MDPDTNKQMYMSMEVNREPRKKHYVYVQLIYDKEMVIYTEEKVVLSINSFGQQHAKELNWILSYTTHNLPSPTKRSNS